MMLAVVAVGDLCTEAVEAAEAVVQVIFNKIDALFLQLNQKEMTDCHLITVFCTSFFACGNLMDKRCIPNDNQASDFDLFN